MVLASILIYCLTVCFGISIGYHRLFSHRSFKAPKWFENLVAVLGCYATGGPPIAWIAHHRIHHTYADTNQEPHSCRHVSSLRLYFSIWDSVIIPRKFVRDLYKKKFLVFVSKNYFILLLSVILLLSLWGIDKLAYLYCLPAVLSFNFFGLINVLGHDRHQLGSTAVNNFFVSLVTFGEGWHQNHHFYPNSYRVGLQKNQFDVAAFFIEKFGFANHKIAFSDENMSARRQTNEISTEQLSNQH